MAASILKGMNFPALVSSVEIDAAGKRVIDSKNCIATGIEVNGGGLSFSRLDEALPFFPPDARGILASAPILEELNDYHLKVTGLAAGKYEVRIGGKKVAEVTSEQLAAGKNFAAEALTEGPIAEQVKAVQSAIEKKNGFHHSIFRGIVLADAPGWVHQIIPAAELESKRQGLIQKGLDKLPELEAIVAEKLNLKANRFEIVPIK